MFSRSAPPLNLQAWVMRWLPWVVLCLGLPFTFWQYQRLAESETATELAQFQDRSGDLVTALQRHLSTNADLLRGVAGLFASSRSVDRLEFHTYVAGLRLLENYPGIQGVGYAQSLTQAELAEHERTVRQQGFRDYRVHPRGARQRLSSIVYLEPFDWRNQRAFGYDMYAEPVRREAMERAMRQGNVAMTGLVKLVQETEQDIQPGFLIYVPIYRNGLPVVTEAQRLAALQGWAYSPLRANDLINSLLQREFSGVAPLMRLEVYAGNQADPDKLFYRHLPEAAAQGKLLTYERPLTLFGQTWWVKVTGSVQPKQKLTFQGSHLILLAGLLFTFFTTGVTWWIQRHQGRLVNALEATVEANRKLAENEAVLRLSATVMEVSPLGMIVTDTEHRMIKVNPAFSRITGYSAEEALGMVPKFLCTATQSQAFCDQIWLRVQEHGLWEGELDNRRKDGSHYPAFLTITRVLDAQGQTVHHVGLFSDISARRLAEERIRHLALHDYLTGLPNRAFFVEHGNAELAMARRQGGRLAFLFLDLDKFKPINDEHGHEAGDAVLVEVSRRLRSKLRESDMVCRLGGDEFVVLLHDFHSPDNLLDVARKLHASIGEPIAFKGRELSVSCSMGISTYPEHGGTLDELIQSADTAMYRAKATPDQPITQAQT